MVTKSTIRFVVSVAVAYGLSSAAPLRAQELSVLGGMGRASAPSESSYSWGFTYLQALDHYNALSYSWINEGHFTGHHRDGFALQYWRRAWFFDQHLALAAGIGAYNFFDTTASDEGRPYSDVHGWAMIYSLSATWYTRSSWFYQLRLNQINAFGSIHTTTGMLGIGYQLDASGGQSASSGGWDLRTNSRNELTALAGITEVNSLHSPSAFAMSAEYRHGFGSYVDATLTWIDEGKTELTRRNGVASQVWLSRGFYDDKLRLGFGAGPYIAVDTWRVHGGTESGDKVSALITMTASYQFAKHWLVRASWNRVLTGYDKDSDIYLAGVGYRF